jgi:hypothetical protein
MYLMETKIKNEKKNRQKIGKQLNSNDLNESLEESFRKIKLLITL